MKSLLTILTMKTGKFLTPFCILLCGLHVTCGFRILTVLLFGNRSNMNYFDPIHLELAKRGHSITVITPTHSLVKHENIKEFNGLDFTKTVQAIFNSKEPNFFEKRLEGEKMLNLFYTTGQKMVSDCDLFYKLDVIQDLIKSSTEKYDLVMTMSYMNECVYGIIDKLNTSSVLIGAIPALPWFAASTGSPTPLSFVPHTYWAATSSMTFTERLGNLVTYLVQIVSRKFYNRGIEQVYQRYIPGSPGIDEIQNNVSLILSAGHFTFGPQRPKLPDLVDEIGGIHCRPAKPLPREIKQMIEQDGKEKDFIFFSLGSIVQSKSVPVHMRDMFMRTFAKFQMRYNILWKWEDDERNFEVASNVKLSKWFPQQDVLGHSRCKLFITHGGLSSIHEAVYHGVPVIGIPFFADQEWNVKQIEAEGAGLRLPITDLNENDLTLYMQNILDNASFSINMKRHSELFRDRQVSALDKAVWWIEYVLRHGGAPHLRSPARELNILQYYCVDLILFLFTIVLATILAFHQIVKWTLDDVRGNVRKSKNE